MNIESVIAIKYDKILMRPERIVSPEIDALDCKHGKQLEALINALPNYTREILELCDTLNDISMLERREDFSKGFFEGILFMQQAGGSK